MNKIRKDSNGIPMSKPSPVAWNSSHTATKPPGTISISSAFMAGTTYSPTPTSFNQPPLSMAKNESVFDKYGIQSEFTMLQNCVYLVHFRVQKKISPGERMAVLGSLDSLGVWKTPLYFLKWTEGDWWVSEKPLVVKNTHHFNYKYAMIENKK